MKKFCVSFFVLFLFADGIKTKTEAKLNRGRQLGAQSIPGSPDFACVSVYVLIDVRFKIAEHLVAMALRWLEQKPKNLQENSNVGILI